MRLYMSQSGEEGNESNRTNLALETHRLTVVKNMADVGKSVTTPSHVATTVPKISTKNTASQMGLDAHLFCPR